MISKCNCKYKFQDEIYGDNLRLFTKTLKGHRCTVCGNDKIVTISKKEIKEEKKGKKKKK